MDPLLPPISTVWSQGMSSGASDHHEEVLRHQDDRSGLGSVANTFALRGQPLSRTFNELHSTSPPIRTRLTFDDADNTDARPAGPCYGALTGHDHDVAAEVTSANITSHHDGVATRCPTRKRPDSHGLVGPYKRLFVGPSGHEVCEATTPANTPAKRTSTPQRGSILRNRNATTSARRKRVGKSPASATRQSGMDSVQRSHSNQTPSNSYRDHSSKTPGSSQRGRSHKTPNSSQSTRRSRTPSSAQRGGRNGSSGSALALSRPRRILFNMHKMRKPQHWRFIQLVCKDDYSHIHMDDLRSEHARCAFCNKCGVEIAFEKSNTAHVTKHMKTRHPKELKQATEEEESRRRNKTQILVHTKPNNLPTASDYQEAATAEEQLRADDLASIWVAKSMRPFSITSDKYFRKYSRYINSVCGRVNIIKPWKTRERVEVIAAELRETLKEKVSAECDYYSASSDIWTSRSKLAFICLTLHYLDTLFKMHSWVLEVKLLPGKHDAYHIADSLEKSMLEWGLQTNKCVKFLRDGASNGVKACALLHLDSMSYLAHCLHLIVGSGIVKKKADKTSKEMLAAAKTDGEFDDALEQEACEEVDRYIAESCESSRSDLEKLRGVVEKFRKLAVFFSRSVKGSDCLKSLQSKELLPKTDCATRWNSTYAMLLRMLELRSALAAFFDLAARTGEFSYPTSAHPTVEDWLTIRCLVTLLEPFAKATDGLGGQKYPTLVIAVPVLRSIERKLNNANIFDPIIRSVANEEFGPRVETLMHSVRETYIELFSKRFKDSLPPDLLWISVLDPRSAELKHLSHGESTLAVSRLKVAAFEMAKEINTNKSSYNEAAQVASDSVPQSGLTRQNVAWLTDVFSGGMDEYVEEPLSVADDMLKDECESQVRQYLRDAHGTPVTTDVLDWWAKRRTKYPIVSALARKWLGCIATSVPSERAFSKSGNVVTTRRCSLAPDIIRDTLFVSENYEENDDNVSSEQSDNSDEDGG